MNLLIFTRVINFTNTLKILSILALSSTALADWKIDFSRRQKALPAKEFMQPMKAPEKKGFLGKLFSAETPASDVVILNTEKGFVPKTLRLRKGVKYRVHLVNVNKSEKNISFILDAFSQHHSTFYGVTRSFEIHPQKEGVFSFQCPETAGEGKLVVFQPPKMNMQPQSAMRFPASEQ